MNRLGVTLSVCALICLPAGCNTQAPPDDVPLQRVAADFVKYPLPPFAIEISTDRTTGVVGTTFTLTATVQGAAEPFEIFAWQADNNETSEEPQFSVSFDEPGNHTVRLAVRDADGQSATNDLLLTVFDPADAPANVDSTIEPAAGYPETIVQITSANLLTPDGIATVQVGDSDELQTYRPLLGQASFVVPLDAADGLTQSTKIDSSCWWTARSSRVSHSRSRRCPKSPARPGN